MPALVSPSAHQPEHLALARAQSADTLSVLVDEGGDDPGIEGRAALGDSHGGVEEFIDIENAVLEQVAESTL